ncbi:MAG: Yip1 family protein [Pseudomonadota bacterium]
MLDIQATIRWAQGMLFDPQTTTTAYRETQATWRTTFFHITLPVYVAAYLAAALIAWLTGGAFLFGSVTFFLFSLVWVLAWTFVVTFIIDFLAGTFDGRRDYNAAYALVGLCIVPAALGTVVSPVPWLGWLLSLAASIYSLVLLYRYIPAFLHVPDDARVKHFVLSIIGALLVNIVVSSALAGLFAPSLDLSDFTTNSGSVSESADGSIFGGFARPAELAEQAANDQYEPPSDGKLDEAQVERYLYVMERTQALRSRLTEKLDTQNSAEEPSISDVFGGIQDAMRAGTAEMEVVKTAGGNWAEHQWVRQQLETARIHEDLNASTRHNFALFEKYADRFAELGY